MKAFFAKFKTRLYASRFMRVALALFVIATTGLVVTACTKKECRHDYKVAVIVEPTCVEQGYTTYRCPKCRATKNEDYVSALGHNFVDGECARCHAKETHDESESVSDSESISEKDRDFYANMLTSVANTNGYVFEVEGLEITGYLKTEVRDADNNAVSNVIFSFEKIEDAIEIDVEKAVFSLDENGNIIGVLSCSMTVNGGNEQFLSNQKYDFSVILKDDTFYAETTIEDRYDEDDALNRRWTKMPLDQVTFIFGTNTGKTILNAYNALSFIGANIEELRNVIGDFTDSAYGVQKFVLENFFAKTEIEGGYKFRFDPKSIKKAIDYIFDNTVNEIIDDVFGEGAAAKLSAFVIASLDKTLDNVLIDLKALGFDYANILETLDNVYFKFTGTEKYFTNALKSVLGQFDGIKLKAIIANAVNINENDVSAVAGEVLEMFKTQSVMEVIAYFVAAREDGQTTEEAVAEAREYLVSIAEKAEAVLGTDAFGFNTDEDGNITSFSVCSNEWQLDSRNDQNGNYFEYKRTVIDGKIDIIPGELGDISEYETIISKIEDYIRVQPNTRMTAKVYGAAAIEFVADENGEITEINVLETSPDLHSYSFRLIGYYGLYDYGYCGGWINYEIFFEVYDEVTKESDIESERFYYNVTTKVLTTDAPQYHEYEIVPEESDYVCGGHKTLKCSACGNKITVKLAHIGELKKSYKLAVEGSSCVDGTIIITTCSACEKVVDESFVYSSKHYYEASGAEEIEIPGKNEDCKFKLYVSECICGKQIIPETVGHKSVSMVFCEDGITEEQGQIDGVFMPGTYREKYESLDRCYKYACMDCDLAVYYEVKWIKAENCTIELTGILRYEHGEDSGILKTYLFETHTYHDYEITTNTNPKEYSIESVCKNCGSYFNQSVKDYTDDDGIYHKEEIVKILNNINDGKNRSAEQRSIIASGDNFYREEYYFKSVGADGKIFEISRTSESTLYEDIPKELDIGVKTVTNDNGVKTVTIIARRETSDKSYVLYEYREESDGAWVKREYTYDFAAGCRYTVRITYSNGVTRIESGTDHDTENRTITDSSCAADEIHAEYCRMCEQIVGDPVVSKASGHEFVTRDKNGNRICYKCGALEDVGDTVITGVTLEDVTDYEDGENYLVAYNGLRSDDFVYTVVLREKWGLGLERRVIALIIGDDKYFTDSENKLVGVNKAAADAAAKAKIKELGLNADDYYLTISFEIPYGTETATVYREFKQPPLTEGAVTGECYYTIVGDGGVLVEITLTFTENVTMEIVSLGKADTKASLYNENGEFLLFDDDSGYGSGNFMITYTFEAGKTYALRAGYYSADAAKGEILLSFTKVKTQIVE